ncbi:cilia- and flagella-associated protein 70-like isoform X2 [Tubulanus polymorphus]|uniref:cilia- and flagella-associated protein 70-like isoform X2 n=1 Tax=Tubulanus polymorphus TaxID=672921 RepID=UPI003DA47CB4
MTTMTSEPPETVQVRPPEPISITVLRVRNLKGVKGDNVNTIVKLEFGEKTLGESTKVECTPDIPAEINFNSTINCSFDDPLSLDELASHPLLVTIIEVLPKEKKQKEEKTQILGQSSFDLLPLVKGESKFKHTLQIHSIPGSPLENLPPEHPKPEIDIQLSVNEALISEAQQNEVNLMTVTVGSCYSPPEAWTILGTQFMYTVSMPVPLTSEKENVVVFPNGQLKPPVDKEPPTKELKWLFPGLAQGNACNIPERFISSDPVEDEDGDFKSKDDKEHRSTSEQEKNRVTWNTERHSFMEASACKNLEERIAKCRYWPVEVMRLPLAPPGGKPGAGKKDDESMISYHGIVYVNMAPLLYPGVKRIRGAYKILPFNENEVFEKTKRKGTLAEEAARIASGMMSRTMSSPFPKGKAPEKGEKKEVKKGKSPAPSDRDEASAMLKPSETGSEVDGTAVVNVEGQQYVDAKSYVMLEISLLRPLVPKKAPEELAKRVSEYIPPRPLFPKRTNGAQKSVEEYHNQVASVAGLILDEFRELFGEQFAKGEMVQSHEAMEKRRQQLMYELNSSGKYFAFKEQLKYSVVKIVREKYLKTIDFEDKENLQSFLSELYVYIIDQMHVGLSKALSLKDQTPVPEPLTDAAQLKHFAREAEVNENFEWATKYYQERIARYKNDPEAWYDYGTFCLYINDLTKAEECFKECIAIDQRNINGLILYAICCAMQEKNEEAEIFFEAATCVDDKSILAWTLLGLFYDGINNEIGAEMALIEANRLNVAAAVNAVKAAKAAEEAKENKDKANTDLKEVVEVEKTSEEVTGDGSPDAPASDVLGAAPEIKAVGPTPNAAPGSQVSSADLPKSPKTKERKPSHTGGRKGRIRSTDSLHSGRPASRQVPISMNATPQPGQEQESEEPAAREPTPVPTTSIFMQTIEFLLEAKAMPFTERALAHELLLPTGGPTSEYHIAYARLKLQRKEFEEAEESLNEALEQDYQHPDAWALMGHLKYLLGDNEAANECYERTLSFMAQPSETHSIYLRLASIYLHDKKFMESKQTFLKACKQSPSCVSWLGVGIACYRLNELSEAEDALSEANILNNYDPEVWGYLSLVCLKTGRQLEAEQAYKYALKLNLQDGDLLNEIRQVQTEVGFGDPQL